MAHKNDALDIATEVKVWMARRRMTQAELGRAAGHDQTWISKRLSGKVPMTVEDLLDLAGALNVPAVEFFRLSDPAASGTINYRKSA